MKRNLFWKFLFIVFIVGWSLYELYPPAPRPLLDEFEQRAENVDTNFTAILTKARQLEQSQPERSYLNLREAISTNDITRYFPMVKIEAGERDPARVILHDLQRSSSGQIKLGLDLQGGTSFLVGLDTNRLERIEAKDRALSQAIEVLRKRVDRFGVSEPLIQPAGDNKILIQLPGLSEAQKEDARQTIQRAAYLEFRMVHPRSEEQISNDLIPPGYELLMETRKDSKTGAVQSFPYIVKKKPERGLTGKYVRRAGVVPDPVTGEPRIILEFNNEGAQIFGQVTRENVGERLGIVLDGQLQSAPRINEPIPGGSAEISGSYSFAEAFTLANVLENPLEAPVRIEQEMSVEPSLGKDSIRSGLTAALIGTIAVAAFMLIYYLFGGLIANVALILNIVILLGVMCSVDTVLTLPGIAGIVLTIGMAVDANVLIFERIREELAAGKSIRGALTGGYEKAFGTIFDSNLTTLIASIILIFMGTGPVKGFGVALTIGVAASMFTALIVTRTIFEWLLNKGWLRSMRMLQLIHGTKFDFLSWSKPAFILSWSLALIGAGYGVWRGKEVMGVDFAGGDQLLLSFQQKVEVGQIRDTVANLKIGEPLVQYQRDLGSGTELLQVTTAFETSSKVKQALQEKFPDAKFKEAGVYKVGPSVGQQILKTAVVAVLLALFGILVYVAFRYEFSFAVGAVVAVIHDIMMTLGWFCLSGREFSAPMVAAVLTIIGFSINDTIVIFDRIREDLKLGVRGTFKDVMNQALNQTLSRTIITSGTVFLSTAALYLFGGPVINDFAFTFLVGILTGTYSSIYIASALVLWWHKGERPKTAGSQVALNDTVTARV
ncbi:MAG: protein translocase subunit SecD [Verrucomicrobiota bacterium]|jgi:SecD/SecF fusion protein